MEITNFLPQFTWIRWTSTNKSCTEKTWKYPSCSKQYGKVFSNYHWSGMRLSKCINSIKSIRLDSKLIQYMIYFHFFFLIGTISRLLTIHFERSRKTSQNIGRRRFQTYKRLLHRRRSISFGETKGNLSIRFL